MPSILLGNTLSGAITLISGNPYSGQLRPVGGVQLRWISASGSAYVTLSGGTTIASGNFASSGGPSSGMLDGMPMLPGDSYFIPALGVPAHQGQTSGIWNIFAVCDPLASGIGRMYWEVF